MKETYFEEIKRRAIEAAMWTNDCAKAGDINRNHANYGALGAWMWVLNDMGHKTNLPVWEDNGCLKIPFVEIDGTKVIEFEEMK